MILYENDPIGLLVMACNLEPLVMMQQPIRRNHLEEHHYNHAKMSNENKFKHQYVGSVIPHFAWVLQDSFFIFHGLLLWLTMIFSRCLFKLFIDVDLLRT